MKGSGCDNCPLSKQGCGATYRGSQCAALRHAHGVDFDPKTNFERITATPESLYEYVMKMWGCLPEYLDWLQQPAEETP